VTSSFNVLISSAGRRHTLLDLHRRALAELGLKGLVMAADASILSAAGRAADRFFVVPRCNDPEFVPKMLALCQEQEVALLVPTIDPELPILAAHREAFRAIGTTVLVSTPEVIAIGGDKVRTHEWLTRSELPTVRQATVREAHENRSEWPFPFLVKPAQGSSAIGVAVVRNADELRVACHDSSLLVQSIAPGFEYTIDILVDRGGRLQCAVPRRRLEVRAGEVSKAITVRSGVLQELASRVCGALPGSFGCLNFQVFLDDASAKASIIEVNPRFGGGYPLAWAAGAKYPRWIIEDILGLPSTVAADTWRSGVLMLRYDEAVYADSSQLGFTP